MKDRINMKELNVIEENELYGVIGGCNKYGAQNEVYNDDWAENGLIVLCFS